MGELRKFKKKSGLHRKIIIYLFVFSFLLLYFDGSKGIMSMPFGDFSPYGMDGRILRSVRPVSPYIPPSQREYEKALTGLQRLCTPARRSPSQDPFPFLSGAAFREVLFSLWLMVVICLLSREPTDRMRRALIRYIHHKEDQQ